MTYPINPVLDSGTSSVPEEHTDSYTSASVPASGETQSVSEESSHSTQTSLGERSHPTHTPTGDRAGILAGTSAGEGSLSTPPAGTPAGERAGGVAGTPAGESSLSPGSQMFSHAVHAVAHSLSEINRLDPSVRSFDDLKKLPTFPEFDRMVRRGYTLSDAFRLANFDRLRQQYALASAQEARNSIHSRSHLRASSGHAGDAPAAVPADILAQYRALNPGVSDAEIRKHWERTQKNT